MRIEYTQRTGLWYFPDMTAARTVPSFALYGEPGSGFASLLHIETIAARSVLHDWEIAEHRHEHSVQLLLVLAGQARASVDGREAVLESPGFICVPQGTVHGFRFDPGTSGYVVTLSVDFLARLSKRDDPLLSMLTEGARGELPEDARGSAEWLAEELLRQMQRWPVDERRAANLFEALLRTLPAPRMAGAGDARLAQFRQLVERHMAEHRPVSFYAAKAGLSARSLGRLCAEHWGCSPRQAINRRLAAEADRMLRHTSASAVQVSDALGFRDPSYFTRFFQRETGRLPSSVKRG